MKWPTVALVAGAMLLQAMTALADDAEFTRRLVGTWIESPGSFGTQRETITYYSDGTCIAYFYAQGRPETTGLRIDANWSIKDSILTKTTTSSIPPERISPGIKVVDHVISISEDRLVYEDPTGERRDSKSVFGMITRIRRK